VVIPDVMEVAVLDLDPVLAAVEETVAVAVIVEAEIWAADSVANHPMVVATEAWVVDQAA
jgi:hypothetical protein